MNKLKMLMAEIFDIDVNSIHDDISKENCKEWDSFNHIILLTEVEKLFNVDIPIEESEQIDSLKDLVNVLGQKVDLSI